MRQENFSETRMKREGFFQFWRGKMLSDAFKKREKSDSLGLITKKDSL